MGNGIYHFWIIYFKYQGFKDGVITGMMYEPAERLSSIIPLKLKL